MVRLKVSFWSHIKDTIVVSVFPSIVWITVFTYLVSNGFSAPGQNWQNIGYNVETAVIISGIVSFLVGVLLRQYGVYRILRSRR